MSNNERPCKVIIFSAMKICLLPVRYLKIWVVDFDPVVCSNLRGVMSPFPSNGNNYLNFDKNPVELFQNFTSISFVYLLTSWVRNYTDNRSLVSGVASIYARTPMRIACSWNLDILFYFFIAFVKFFKI